MVANADSLMDATERRRLLGPYRWATLVSTGARVLDLGSGRCAGSREIASHGSPSLLVAIDVEQGLVATSPDGLFHRVVADGQTLPFADGAFSLVLCFEVVEHVPDPLALLREARRVGGSHGVVLVSTPNRRVRLLPFQRPWNPEHLTEYNARQFAALLGYVFPAVRVFEIGADPQTYRHYRGQWRRASLRRAARLPLAAWRRLRRLARRSAPRDQARSDAESTPSAHGSSFIASRLPVAPLNFVAVCSMTADATSAAASQLDRVRIPW
jgi:ubiquinone/menaquinone biosynthesis C-methylase UbiE